MRVYIMALDPRKSDGTEITAKDGRLKVAEFAISLSEGLTVRHCALWYQPKGNTFSVEMPGNGYGRFPITDGQYEDVKRANGQTISVWTEGEGKVLGKIRELVLEAYGKARDAAKASAEAPRLVQGQK